MLKDLGAFIPFGAFITRDGEVQLAGGEGGPSHLDTEEIVEMYLEAYREAAAVGDFPLRRCALMCAYTFPASWKRLMLFRSCWNIPVASR